MASLTELETKAFLAGYREARADWPNDDSGVSARLYAAGIEVARECGDDTVMLSGTSDSALRLALVSARGISSGPDGTGRMKVMVTGLQPGTEHVLRSLLSSALVEGRS